MPQNGHPADFNHGLRSNGGLFADACAESAGKNYSFDGSTFVFNSGECDPCKITTMESSDASRFRDLSVVVPVYQNDVRWFSQQIKGIEALVAGGAEVVVGLNGASANNSAVVNLLPDATVVRKFVPALAREDHWTELLQSSSRPLVRYWFAGDEMSRDVLDSHVQILRDDRNAAMVFSPRTVAVGPFVLPGQVGARLKYWGRSTRQVSRAELMNSVIDTASNFIGEPTFVTFRRTAAPRAWVHGFEYAVDLAMYGEIARNGHAVWLPDIAGRFGVTAGSTSVELERQQVSDMVALAESWSVDFDRAVFEKRLYSLTRARILIYRVMASFVMK
jgi:hypothetical protein